MTTTIVSSLGQDPGLHRFGNPCRLWHRIRRQDCPSPDARPRSSHRPLRRPESRLPEGARILYGRISMAARKACGPSFALWYPTVEREWKHCYQATVDHAVKQVNSPALTALYEKGINVAAR